MIAESQRGDKYFIKFGVLFFAVGIVLFFRSRNAFFHPVVECEDGNQMLAFYHNSPSPSGILRVYAGYISLLPNTIGYFSSQAPLSMAPYILTYFPLVVAVFAHSLLCLRRFRVLIPSDQTRFWVCLFLAAMPAGDVLLISNTAYSIWNLLWILILLAFAPLSGNRIMQGLQFLVLVILACSHALSLVILPICFYNLVTRRRIADWLFNIGLIVVIVLYVSLAIVVNEDQFLDIWNGLTQAFLLVLNRVIFEPLFGYQWRMALQNAGASSVIYWISGSLLALLGVLYVLSFRRLSRQRHVQILLCGYLIFVLTILPILSRSTSSPSLWGPWEFRYFYIQQKLWLLSLAIVVGVYLASKSVRTRWLVAVPVCLYVAIVSAHNYSQFQTSPQEGQRLAQFLERVNQARSESHHNQREFTLKRSCFDIHLTW